MKQLKALEILNQYVKDKEWILNNIKKSSPHKEREIKIITDDLNVGKEAIAELEALGNRSCDGCEYDYVDIDDNCPRCKRYDNDDYYKAKE